MEPPKGMSVSRPFVPILGTQGAVGWMGFAYTRYYRAKIDAARTWILLRSARDKRRRNLRDQTVTKIRPEENVHRPDGFIYGLDGVAGNVTVAEPGIDKTTFKPRRANSALAASIIGPSFIIASVNAFESLNFPVIIISCAEMRLSTLERTNSRACSVHASIVTLAIFSLILLKVFKYSLTTTPFMKLRV
jgi:hypothetical protein